MATLTPLIRANAGMAGVAGKSFTALREPLG